MNNVVALFPQKKEFSGLQMLQSPEYRSHSITAIESANRFRRLFEGSPFHRLRILRRERTKEELVMLLIKRGVTKSCQEAEEFIRSILGSEIPYTEYGEYYALRKKVGEDSYCLEYSTTAFISIN